MSDAKSADPREGPPQGLGCRQNEVMVSSKMGPLVREHGGKLIFVEGTQGSSGEHDCLLASG